MSEKLRIAVLTPYFGGIDSDHKKCMDFLGRIPHGKGDLEVLWFTAVYNWPWIDMAQSFLVDTTLEDVDANVLFWIEHDMIFNPADVIKMSRHLLDSDYDMLGASYSKKHPCAGIVGGINQEVTYFQPGLFDTDMCAFGFTATKPSLYKKLRETLPYVNCPPAERKVYPYFAHMVEPEYIGQDASFCIRVKNAGMKIGIDAEIRVGHKGSYIYHLEDISNKVEHYQLLRASPQGKNAVVNPPEAA